MRFCAGNARKLLTCFVLKISSSDRAARQARRAGKIIDLTNREFALLELLMMTAPRPVSKAVIIERVWNQYFDSQTNVVNVYVNHLRSMRESARFGSDCSNRSRRRICSSEGRSTESLLVSNSFVVFERFSESPFASSVRLISSNPALTFWYRHWSEVRNTKVLAAKTL